MPARFLVRSVGRLAAAFLFAVVVACGDDGKVGTSGGPVSAPAATPGVPASPGGTAAPGPSPGLPIPTPVPPVAGAPVSPSPRVGDWVTWEIRVTGGAAATGKTTLTWRATAVEAARLLLRVDSATTDAAGKTIATSSTEDWVPWPAGPPAAATAGPVAPPAPGTPNNLTEVHVGAVTIPTRAAVRGETTVGYADAIPLGGVAWSRGPGGVEQTVVGFGRGS
jgi:hypothetical protein